MSVSQSSSNGFDNERKCPRTAEVYNIIFTTEYASMGKSDKLTIYS